MGRVSSQGFNADPDTYRDFVDEQDPNSGVTALWIAARDGNVPIVKLLLNAGAWPLHSDDEVRCLAQAPFCP